MCRLRFRFGCDKAKIGSVSQLSGEDTRSSIRKHKVGGQEVWALDQLGGSERFREITVQGVNDPDETEAEDDFDWVALP